MKGWIHVFRTGEWTDSAGNKKKWTEEDLDAIVSKYQAEGEDVPLCVGHPSHDSPAYGWVDQIKRVGQNLWVKPKQVMKEFLDAVKAGRYKKISIALRTDLSLRHIGFLGGVAPAVKGLTPVEMKDGDYSVFELVFKKFECEDDRVITFNREENDMDELEELKAELAKKEQEIKELGGKYQESDEQRMAVEEQLKSLRLNIRTMEFEQYLKEHLAYGQLTEDQSKTALAILEVLSSSTFSELPDGVQFAEFKTGKKTPVDAFKEILDALPKKVEFAEFATKKKAGDPAGEPATEGDEMQFTEGKKNITVDQARMNEWKKAKQREKEKKITFREALNEIREEARHAAT